MWSGVVVVVVVAEGWMEGSDGYTSERAYAVCKRVVTVARFVVWERRVG